ncbi:hypothetical protein Tco_0925829 [Tanacetum coccineum]|uniref:Uncharacterized protein n=1 Tax=Tanacetum coccineum TaxID=301880 RepID=A0ABQ5D969_9ASTR
MDVPEPRLFSIINDHKMKERITKKRTKDKAKTTKPDSPYPAKGHVTPLIDAARRFTRNGLKVTFVNTEATHQQVMNAWSEKDDGSDLMHTVGIPDGMEPWEERNDIGKLTETMFRVMPSKLEELIKYINKTNDEIITCIIADYLHGMDLKSCTEDEY